MRRFLLAFPFLLLLTSGCESMCGSDSCDEFGSECFCANSPSHQSCSDYCQEFPENCNGLHAEPDEPAL